MALIDAIKKLGLEFEKILEDVNKLNGHYQINSGMAF